MSTENNKKINKFITLPGDIDLKMNWVILENTIHNDGSDVLKLPINESMYLDQFNQLEDNYKKFFLSYIATLFVPKKYLAINSEDFDLLATVDEYEILNEFEKYIPYLTYHLFSEEYYLSLVENICNYCGNTFDKDKEMEKVNSLEPGINNILKKINWI